MRTTYPIKAANLSWSLALLTLLLILPVVGRPLWLEAQEEIPDKKEKTLPPEDLEKTIRLEAPAAESLSIVEPVGPGSYLRMGGVLVFILLLVYGVVWILRKLFPSGPLSHDSIRILDTRILRKDLGLHLVEVGREIFLVGSASQGITLIARIEDKESLDEIRLQEEKPRAPTNFRQELKKRLFPVPFRREPLKMKEGEVEFLKHQKDRLKDLS